MLWRAELRAWINRGCLSPRFRRLLVNRFQHNRGVLTSNFLLCGDSSSILRLATSGLIPPCAGRANHFQQPRIWRIRGPTFDCLGTRDTLHTCTAGSAQAADGCRASGCARFCDLCLKLQPNRVEGLGLSSRAGLASMAIVRMPEGKGKVLAVPKLVPLLRGFIQAQLAHPERQFQPVRAGWPGRR
jgi:hypothetical protein